MFNIIPLSLILNLHHSSILTTKEQRLLANLEEVREVVRCV